METLPSQRLERRRFEGKKHPLGLKVQSIPWLIASACHTRTVCAEEPDKRRRSTRRPVFKECQSEEIQPSAGKRRE